MQAQRDWKGDESAENRSDCQDEHHEQYLPAKRKANAPTAQTIQRAEACRAPCAAPKVRRAKRRARHSLAARNLSTGPGSGLCDTHRDHQGPVQQHQQLHIICTARHVYAQGAASRLALFQCSPPLEAGRQAGACCLCVCGTASQASAPPLHVLQMYCTNDSRVRSPSLSLLSHTFGAPVAPILADEEVDARPKQQPEHQRVRSHHCFLFGGGGGDNSRSYFPAISYAWLYSIRYKQHYDADYSYESRACLQYVVCSV